MRNNFIFLQIMSHIYLFFGGAIITIGSIAWIISMVNRPYYYPLGLIDFALLIYSLVAGLGFMGAGQVLQAIREIAINTRMQNHLLTLLIERRSGNKNNQPINPYMPPPKYNYPVPPDPNQF